MGKLADFQFQYVEGQGRSTFPALLADYQRLSDLAVAAPDVQIDQAYGPHPRCRSSPGRHALLSRGLLAVA